MTRADRTGATRVDGGASAPAAPAPVREELVTERSGADSRWDRVRWGPVWAGAIVVVTTFLVLQLLFFALGWLDLGFDGGNSATAASVVSGILALVAFFVGALTAGACTMWRSASDGMLHGVLVWALSVVGILGLALIGGSSLLGPLGSIVAQAPGVSPQDVDVNTTQALNTARQTAGWTVLGLGLAVVAATLGGAAGSKIRPGR